MNCSLLYVLNFINFLFLGNTGKITDIGSLGKVLINNYFLELNLTQQTRNSKWLEQLTSILCVSEKTISNYINGLRFRFRSKMAKDHHFGETKVWDLHWITQGPDYKYQLTLAFLKPLSGCSPHYLDSITALFNQRKAIHAFST